jgi:hypothetical protein
VYPVVAVVVGVVLLRSVAPGGAGPAAGADDGRNVVLLGDSVTEQAFGYLGGPTADAPAHLRRWSKTGWTVADAVAHAGTALTASSTGVLVVALGPNDAASWDDGWNSSDVARWRALLAAPAPDTCVAVVLPGWGAALRGTTWEHDLLTMRADVRALVADRVAAGSPTVEVDWLPIVTAHPDYLAKDGIHLASTAAAHARQDLYWHAAARCPKP